VVPSQGTSTARTASHSSPLEFLIHPRARGLRRPSTPIRTSLNLPHPLMEPHQGPRARRGEVPAGGQIGRKQRLKAGHGRTPWTGRFRTTTVPFRRSDEGGGSSGADRGRRAAAPAASYPSYGPTWFPCSALVHVKGRRLGISFLLWNNEPLHILQDGKTM
jgi:hypothetical protein